MARLRESETKATANRSPSVHSPFAPVSLSNSASDVFCSRSAWNAPIAPVNAVNRLPLTMNDRTNEGVAPAKKSADTAPTHNLPKRLHEPNLAHRTVPSAATQTLPLHTGFNAVQR